MAAVTICSDFGSPKIKSVTVSTVSPSIYHKVMGLDVMIFIFWTLSFKPAVSLSSFTFIKRLLVPLCFLLLEWYHLHIWVDIIFIPACASSSPAFHMMYPAYTLISSVTNWFPVWNRSIVSCLILTVASWPVNRFFWRQVRWSGIPISLRIFQVCCDPHSQRL